MGLFSKRKRFSFEKPKLKVNLSKSTTRHSSLNDVYVGYKVGSGKFSKRLANPKEIEKYGRKLLKENKGLSGKGEERGVSYSPLYYKNRRFLEEMKKRKR